MEKHHEGGCIHQMINSKKQTISERANDAYLEGDFELLKKLQQYLHLICSDKRTRTRTLPAYLVEYDLDDNVAEDKPDSAVSLHVNELGAETYLNNYLRYDAPWLKTSARKVYVSQAVMRRLRNSSNGAMFFEMIDIG